MLLELIFDLVLIGILCFFFGTSFLIGEGADRRGDILGSVGFPRIIILCAFLLLVIQVVNLLRNMKKGQTSANEMSKKPREKTGYIRMVSCMFLILIYILAMQYVGYALATLLFVLALGKIIGYRKNGKLLLFSVVISVALVAVFGTLFSITLPRGLGLLKELSFYWY
mgnify:CR=1 FL=1